MKSLKERWEKSKNDIKVKDTGFTPSFKPSGKPVTDEDREEFQRMLEEHRKEISNK